MRRLGIFLDSSLPMSNPANTTNSDFKPTPLLFSIRLLENFIPDFLRRNTLGSSCVYELRDGICQQISPLVGKWSSNPHQLVGDVQSRFQQKSASGSGTASIVNALRLMCVDLGGSDASSTLGFSGTCSSSALLITSAITLVDAGDVFAAIEDVVKLGISVDVLSLCGAPHVLDMLCQKTGGTLLCPVLPSHTQALISQIAQPTWRKPNGNNNNNTQRQNLIKRERSANQDDEDFKTAQTMTPVALYHDSNSVPTQCPLCRAPQQFKGFPRSCVSCGLLSLSEVQWRSARAEASSSRIVAIPVMNTNNNSANNNENDENYNSPSIVKCQGVCNSSRSCVEAKTVYVDEDQGHSRVTTSGNDSRVIFYVLRCLNCKAAFCGACASLFALNVKMCPCCSVMLEDI